MQIEAFMPEMVGWTEYRGYATAAIENASTGHAGGILPNDPPNESSWFANVRQNGGDAIVEITRVKPNGELLRWANYALPERVETQYDSGVQTLQPAIAGPFGWVRITIV